MTNGILESPSSHELLRNQIWPVLDTPEYVIQLVHSSAGVDHVEYIAGSMFESVPSGDAIFMKVRHHFT